MKKQFVANLGVLLFLNLLIKPFYVLGIDVSIQNTVEAASYGLYFPLLNLTILFMVILDMGVENFTRREVARNPQRLSVYFTNIFLLKILLSLVYFTICLTIGFFSGYDWFQLRLLLILLFNQFLASFIMFFRANLGGLHLFKVESIISVLDKALLIAICSILLWGNVAPGPFRIEWFVYAQTFSYLLTFLCSFVIIWAKEPGIIRFDADLRRFTIIVRKSLPYAAVVLLMAVYYRIDPILLERLLPDGKVQAGIYAHSFRLLDMVQNYGYLFALILLPMFSKLTKERGAIGQLVATSFIIIIVPALIIGVVSVFYSQFIIGLLYHEHVDLSAKVFAVIMPGYIAVCSNYIFGTLLTANGNLKALMIIAAFGALLSIGLNLLLIPSYGVMGSAIANVTSQFFTAIVQFAVAVRMFGFRTNRPLIVRLFLYLFLLVFAGALSTHFTDSGFIGIMLYILAAILLAFAARLIRFSMITGLLKRE